VDEVAARSRAQLDVPTGSAEGGGLLVRLRGELDLASLPDVQPELDRLLGLPEQSVSIDVAELTFLDSTGVAVLIRIANHFHPAEVLHAAPVVRRVIQALGLGPHLGLAEA